MDLGVLRISVSSEHANQSNGTIILIIYHRNLVHLFKGISEVARKEMKAWHLIKALIYTPSVLLRIMMRGGNNGYGGNRRQMLPRSWSFFAVLNTALASRTSSVAISPALLLKRWSNKSKQLQRLVSFPVLTWGQMSGRSGSSLGLTGT